MRYDDFMLSVMTVVLVSVIFLVYVYYRNIQKHAGENLDSGVPIMDMVDIDSLELEPDASIQK
ncbi:hypothetical protein LSG31_14365 [Fodinisporobacter ferrooxydans]|uniref:CcoQ/FixQ family Cbb3-type cytochrome c oxidase assembly chaperone n=1 Tax=Fodinisporobacter ferrooxydans TaxID=2901836 RepID=A0ABY4CI37_9BACL|nr:hypothetical protein LSG31_14365 [Alicyclobacillaceae bacterium MYW30-H2]